MSMKNGSVKIGDATMEYVPFGRGAEHLIMIPGISEAFATIKSSRFALAMMYRQYAKQYRVTIFSRKNKMEAGYSISEMAKDLAAAMTRLGITKAAVFGVSQGGMIAQHMALDFPDRVTKLVLAVTASRPNQTIKDAIGAWIKMAKQKDYKGIVLDTAEKSYSETYIKKYRWSLPLLASISKPKDFTRFIIQGEACIHHDAYSRLGGINCPTLVIGGDRDRIVGVDSSEEMAERIPGSQLVIYKGLGHAAYEEAKDFNQRVLDFLNTNYTQ